MEDEDDLPLSEWVRRIDSVNFSSYDLHGFSTLDDDILITETLTVEDIVTEVKNQQNSASDEKNLQEEEEDNSEEHEIEVNVPTINRALQAGLPPQTQEPRLQFYQGLNRCGSFPLPSALHSPFSI